MNAHDRPTLAEIRHHLHGVAASLPRAGENAATDGKTPLFHYAHVEIHDPASASVAERPRFRDPKWVVTEHARALSWLFTELREAFGARLDASNKYEFFASLVQAANRHLAACPGCDATSLLSATASAAYGWLDAWEAEGDLLDDEEPDMERLRDQLEATAAELEAILNGREDDEPVQRS